MLGVFAVLGLYITLQLGATCASHLFKVLGFFDFFFDFLWGMFYVSYYARFVYQLSLLP